MLLLVLLIFTMAPIDVTSLDQPSRAEILFDIITFERESLVNDAKKVHAYCASLENASLPCKSELGIHDYVKERNLIVLVRRSQTKQVMWGYGIVANEWPGI